MKKRKILRFASIVLAAAMLMTLAGCGDQNAASSTEVALALPVSTSGSSAIQV